MGDEIETYVMRVNDVEGVATLSKKRLDSVKNWDTIEAAVEDKTILEGYRDRGQQGRYRGQCQRASVSSCPPLRPECPEGRPVRDDQATA